MEYSKNSTPSHELAPSSMYNGIPEWFLIEIICKLPSKPLFRYKCVSKQFLTLISDPSFIRIYISRASKPRPWTLITTVAHTEDDSDSYEETFDMERNLASSGLMNNYESPTISKLVTPKKDCRLEAVSNGLFLCCGESVPNVVFNPITKQSILLPEPHLMQKGGTVAFHAHVDQVGVVSYKLARLLINWGVPETDHLIEVLSSKTNKWTFVAAYFPEPIVSSNFFSCFSFKGILHWFDEHSSDESACIISYDPVRLIRSAGSGRIIWCGEIVQTGGEPTIRCIKLDNEGFVHVWRMKDYEKGTWHLDHKFAKNKILLPCADNKIKPCRKLINITFHPSEQDLFYFWGQAEEEEWMLVSFNVGSRESRVSDTVPRARGDFADICKTFFLETPFVLPPWPAILPNLP